MRIVLLFLSFLTLSDKAISGGGWTKDKGALYFKLGQQWVIYDQYFDKDAVKVDDKTRSFGATHLYIEYGISSKITGILYLPFYSKSTIFEQKNASTGAILNKGESLSSIGDTNLSLKYGLVDNGGVVLSTSLMLGVPLGRVEQGSDGSLQTGDGEFNQMLSFDLSSSVKVGNAWPYFSMYMGFNNRLNGFSDELRFGLESGITLSKLNLNVKLYGVESLNNGTIDDDLFFRGLLANNTEYLIFSPEIAFDFTNSWGLSFNFAKAVSGRLIYVQPSYTLGIYFNLNLFQPANL